MTEELVLHPTTAVQLKLAQKRPAHGYLFVGVDGLGKTYAATLFAHDLVGGEVSLGDKERWIYKVAPIKDKKISINQIKELAKFANQSKPQHVHSRVIIIDDAQSLSIEAANSLLLLLEETPKDTVIILVSNSLDRLPKTILSRLQTIRFFEPTSDQIQEFSNRQNIPSITQDSIGNLPAKLFSSTTHEELNIINELSQEFLAGDLITRLLCTSKLTEKNQAEMLIETISRKLVGHTELNSGNRAESLILAQSHLYNNGNTKFVLECLALEFE